MLSVPKPSTSRVTVDAALDGGDQSVADARARRVGEEDVIEDAKRFLRAVDQGDQGVEPLGPVGEQGQPVAGHLDGDLLR